MSFGQLKSKSEKAPEGGCYLGGVVIWNLKSKSVYPRKSSKLYYSPYKIKQISECSAGALRAPAKGGGGYYLGEAGRFTRPGGGVGGRGSFTRFYVLLNLPSNTTTIIP